MGIVVMPIGDRLIVKRMELTEEGENKSLIIIPDGAKEKPTQGEVQQVSQNLSEENEGLIGVGDIVLFSKFAGAEINIKKDEELLILRFDDIMGVVTDDEVGEVFVDEEDTD